MKQKTYLGEKQDKTKLYKAKKKWVTSIGSTLLGVAVLGVSTDTQKVKAAEEDDRREHAHLKMEQTPHHQLSAVALTTNANNKASSTTTTQTSAASQDNHFTSEKVNEQTVTSEATSQQLPSSQEIVTAASATSAVTSQQVSADSASSQANNTNNVHSQLQATSTASSMVTNTPASSTANSTASMASQTSNATSYASQAIAQESTASQANQQPTFAINNAVLNLFVDGSNFTKLADHVTQSELDKLRKQIEQSAAGLQKDTELKLLTQAQNYLDEWQLSGLGNRVFGTIRYFNDGSGKLFISVHGRPHAYYEGRGYATITIKDKNGNLIYQQELIGNQTYNFEKSFILADGDLLTILHNEPFRLLVNKDSLRLTKNDEIKTFSYQINGTQLTDVTDVVYLTDQVQHLFADDQYQKLAFGVSEGTITNIQNAINNSNNLTSFQRQQLQQALDRARQLMAHTGGEIENNKLVSQDIFVLPADVITQVTNENRNMGTYHDRQSLGIILQQGATIRIHQANGNYNKEVLLRLLGDDSAKEASYKIGHNWLEITAKHDLALFIDTPIGTQNGEVPRIEYEIINGSAKKMPTFTINDNQHDFVTEWDNTKAQFALLRANNIQFLVPLLDIELIKNTDLYKLLREYDEQVFALFNQLTGLPTNTDLNHPILGRYFVKADAHGAGSAYYSNNWTAQNGHSISSYLTINWLPIHEIGHGYEIPTDGIDIVDVFNNIYGTLYQEQYLDDFVDNSWLFGGKKEQIINDLFNKLVNEHLTFDEIKQYNQKLLMLMNLVDFKGTSGFIKFNEYHRQLANAGYHKLACDFGSVWAIVFANEYNIDITPYFKAIGIYVDPVITANILNAHKQAVGMITQVVPADKIAEVLQQLGWDNADLKSQLSLITNEQLAALGLQSHVILHITNAEQLMGATINIMDGNRIVKTVVVNGTELDLGTLNNGVYTFMINHNGWRFAEDYLFVKQDGIITQTAVNRIILTEVQQLFSDNTYTKLAANTTYEMISRLQTNINKLNNEQQRQANIALLQKAASMIDQWNLNGLSGNVATVIYRNDDNVLHVKINAGTPHVYIKNTFITITVKDANGKIIFQKNLIGNQHYDAESFDIPFTAGSQLIITHCEPHRLIVSTPDLQIPNQKNLTYEVTKSGALRLIGNNTAPVINIPSADITLVQGEAFDPLTGVTASDVDDGNLTTQIKVTSNVDTNKVGNYRVIYTVTDHDGAITTQTVNVKVLPKQVAINNMPVINVPQTNITLTQGEAFDPLVGVTASDAEDGKLPVVVLQNNVNVNQPGIYHVIYQATDKNGAKVTKQVTVTIKGKANDAPTITVPHDHVTITTGEHFDPLANVSANDTEDGALPVKIIATNLDNSQPGVYQITYQAIDHQGVQVNKTITVTVKAAESTDDTTQLESTDKVITDQPIITTNHQSQLTQIPVATRLPNHADMSDDIFVPLHPTNLTNKQVIKADKVVTPLVAAYPTTTPSLFNHQQQLNDDMALTTSSAVTKPTVPNRSRPKHAKLAKHVVAIGASMTAIVLAALVIKRTSKRNKKH